MKAIISLPIIENNKSSSYLSPKTWMEDGYIIIEWEYKSTSCAVQGQWDTYTEWYKKDEYDYNSAMELLTNFIKREYNL